MSMSSWKGICRGAVSVAMIILAGFLGSGTGTGAIFLPDPAGQWAIPPGVYVGRAAVAEVTVEIRGVGTLSFDPAQVRTLRPDLFRGGHFSVFDALAHLAERGDLELAYAWDEATASHTILSLNGLSGWWYDARYDGGEFERPVLRMDHFPVKDGMRIRLYLEQPDRLAAIKASFREEVARREANGGAVVVPEVEIRSPRWTLVARDVRVEPSGTRSDVFQPDVVIALDVLFALGRSGVLSSVTLVWRDRLDGTDMVSFTVHALAGGGHEAPAAEGCMFAHQTGSTPLERFIAPHTHATSHVHLTADLEAIVSPESVRWAWLCP